MPTTTKAALPYPASTNAPNVPSDIQALATALDAKVLPKFTNVTNRNTAFPSPVIGDNAVVNGQLHIYDGTAWRWQSRGEKNGTTDTGGNLVTAHSLGAVPTGIIIGSATQATDLLNRILSFNWTGKDATNFSLYAHRTDTSVAVVSTQIEVSWLAFV